MFVFGGYGIMFDFSDDMYLYCLLIEFVEDDKLIVVVCYGLVVLVGGKFKNGELIVKGKCIIVFIDLEEKDIMLDKYMLFFFEIKFCELGVEFIVKDNWSDYIEVDGKFLIG